jgi:hypothetical protein
VNEINGLYLTSFLLLCTTNVIQKPNWSSEDLTQNVSHKSRAQPQNHDGPNVWWTLNDDHFKATTSYSKAKWSPGQYTVVVAWPNSKHLTVTSEMESAAAATARNSRRGPVLSFHFVFKFETVLVALVLAGGALYFVDQQQSKLNRNPWSTLRVTDDARTESLKDSSCVWSPNSSSVACRNLIVSYICSKDDGLKLGRRLIVLGDSTNGPNFLFKFLKPLMITQAPTRIAAICPSRYECVARAGKRCNNNEIFGLDYPFNNSWVPPDASRGEGPMSYGLQNPFCSDCVSVHSALLCLLFSLCSIVLPCAAFLSPRVTVPTTLTRKSSCYRRFLLCSLKSESAPCLGSAKVGRSVGAENYIPFVYGGFISSEYARHVELQSPHHLTTQENIALFLRRFYNTNGLIRDWGMPICLVNSAVHDAAIPGITTETYVSNIEWYLKILSRECELIIWLGSTAPLGLYPDRFPQTKQRMFTWNAAVREAIHQRPELNAVFVDVYNASEEYEHRDNIHMHESWYEALAAFFADAVSTRCQF